MLGQVAHVRLHAARDVPGVRAGQADPHRVARAGHREVARARAAAACASPAGAAAMPVCEGVGQRLRHRRHVGVRDRLVRTAIRQPSAVNDRCTGSSVAPVAQREGRGAGGHPRRRAEELAPRRRAPTGRGRRAGTACRRPASRSVSTSNGGRLAAGQRQHLHAERLAEGDEPVVQRLGLQPLGDGRERHAGGAAPGAGGVPVAAVRQRQDGAAAGGDAVAEPLLVHGRRCARRCARGAVTGSRKTSHQ